MAFSVVLFDLDGTLVNTNHLIVATFQHILKTHLGIEVSAETLYTYFGEPLPVTMARYAPDRANELSDLYRVWNIAHHDELVEEFEGVRDMIMTLKQAGVKLAVVTSKKHDTARRGLRVANLEPYFDVVVGMDETEKHKPEPEPALLALERLGEQPGGHVLMVGDSRFDILCGRNAGLRTAAVEWSVTDRAQLTAAGPDYWIKHPSELVRLVLGQA